MRRNAGGAGDRTIARRRGCTRRSGGFTLLEVVLASVLLALIAGAMTGTITLIARLQALDKQRAGGYEIANRLILMHLDDEESVKTLPKTIEYLGMRFRWDLRQENLKMTVKPTEASVRTSTQLSADRYIRLTAIVWEVDEAKSRDGRFAVAGDEVARLSRLYDPVAIMFRNPDSQSNYVKSGGLIDFMRRIQGGAGAAGGAATGKAAPAASSGDGTAGGKTK